MFTSTRYALILSCVILAGCTVVNDFDQYTFGAIDAGPSGPCENGVQDGSETDVDCGGSCGPCRLGGSCNANADCESAFCRSGSCATPACDDGSLNGTESDIDCGGSGCPACEAGGTCSDGSDCASGRCVGTTCVAANCDDGLHNGAESDVDCGGADCGVCSGGQMCLTDGDCVSTCDGGACAVSACDDGVQNADETDVDCGGGTCPACAVGGSCGAGADCESLVCTGGTCDDAACDDAVANGDETDVDCGGSCPSCGDGLVCGIDDDCTGTCETGLCVSCGDGAQNQDESDVDCGGALCGGCDVGAMCTSDADCTGTCDASGTCVGSSCYGGPARVLVYEPGGTTQTAWFPPGTSVTIATEPMWRTMTTTDFAGYHVIFIAGGRCGGTMDSVLGVAQDTISGWGPAVGGRIVITADDADLHGGAPAELFTRNLIDWLKGPGRTSDGGGTSLYLSWGCTMNTSYAAGAPGSPERFASVIGAGATGERSNPCDSVMPTSAGTTHPLLAGLPPFWACPFHGGFPTLPPGFVSLTDATIAPTSSVIAVREAPGPCL